VVGTPLNVSLMATKTATCAGESITITPTGASGATLNWDFDNNGTVDLVSTSDTAITVSPTVSRTVKLNAVKGINKGMDSVNITVTPLPTTSAINGDVSVCSNSTGKIYSVTNTSGASYAWTVPTGATITAGSTTNSITVTFGTTSGDVSVIETSNGCVGASVMKTVTVNALPTATLSLSGIAILSVTPTTGASYEWFSGTSSVSTTSSNTYTALSNGSYTVKVTANNCATTSNSQMVSIVTGIEDDTKLGIGIYPNPFDGVLTIELSESTNSTISIYDIVGNLQVQTLTEGGVLLLDVKKLSTGIYIIKIETPTSVIQRTIYKR
jgi:PKD-like domain/Secretion system C-terminal sorting domain